MNKETDTKNVESISEVIKMNNYFNFFFYPGT